MIPRILRPDAAGRIHVGHRAEDVDLLVPERSRPRTDGCLHREEGEHLQEVVLHHVAQRSHRVVERPAVVHAEVLGHRDLYRSDMVAVPHRFEERIGEPEEEHVEDRLLPQEVIDTQDLVLRQHLMEFDIEGACRLEVVTEGLLYHDGRVLGQSRLSEPRHHPPEKERRNLQIEERSRRTVQQGGQRLVRCGIGDVALEVGESLRQPHLGLRVDGLSGVVESLSDGRTELIL